MNTGSQPWMLFSAHVARAELLRVRVKAPASVGAEPLTTM